MTQGESMLLDMLAEYYGLQAKLPSGLSYFDKPNCKEEVFQRFTVLMENAETLYNNIKRAKKDKQFPMFTFLEMEHENFLIRDGDFYGSKEKALMYAGELLSQCGDDFCANGKVLELYEKYLFISSIANLSKKDFIPFPEGYEFNQGMQESGLEASNSDKELLEDFTEIDEETPFESSEDSTSEIIEPSKEKVKEEVKEEVKQIQKTKPQVKKKDLFKSFNLVTAFKK